MEEDRAQDDKENIKVALRKLRKKLRQIENLEKLTRPLTVEETFKFKTKEDCRESLQSFLVLAEQFDVSTSETSGYVQEVKEDTSETSGYTQEVKEDTSETSGYTQEVEEDKNGGTCVTGISSNGCSVTSDTDADLHSDLHPDMNHPEQEPALVISQSTTINEMGKITTELVEVDDKSRTDHVSPDQSDSRKRKREVPTTKVSDFKKKVMEVRKAWSKCRWNFFDGHNDKICSLDWAGDVLVSASKDTTCKLWKGDGSLYFSLGDHTSSVSGVFLEGDKVITTSYDCKLRIWGKESGNLEHTQYLFSPITCAVRLNDMLLIGTEGGKLIYYCVKSLTVKWEGVAHSESINCLTLNDGFAASTSHLPDLCLWSVSENGLTLCKDNSLTIGRIVRCMLIHQDILYFGDDGVNIKMLNLKTQELDKLRNHEHEFGSTDAMIIYCNEFLVSSSYNLDNGQSSLNFRSLSDHTYLFTIQCPLYGPITCLSSDTCLSCADSPALFCGGSELGIITANTNPESEEIEVKSLSIYRDCYRDSWSEHSTSDDESQSPPKAHRINESQSSRSWCSIS